MAACEKRRSGLAPKTTQGPGTKTESRGAVKKNLFFVWSERELKASGFPKEVKKVGVEARNQAGFWVRGSRAGAWR